MRRVVAVATKELHQIVRDQRTLAILEGLRATECKRDGDPCCFKKSRALQQAISTLQERLRG